MKKQPTFSDFQDKFNAVMPGCFSPSGLRALYIHLLESAEDSETEFDALMELDVIALCCDYAEVNKEELIIAEIPGDRLLVRVG